MAIEVFNRYEFKYQLPLTLAQDLIEVFQVRLNLDDYCKQHGTYKIVNRYIDTTNQNLIRKSISKPKYKHKLRIRTYNEVIADDDLIFFEIKKKYKGIVNKRRCQMTYNEAKYLMKHKQLATVNDYTNQQILAELVHILKQDDYLEQSTIIYNRIAFFDNNKDLRISFDFNIHSNNYQLLNPNFALMEIKTAGSMPLWLVELLNKNNIRKQSFSKYGTDFLMQLEEKKYESINY